MNEKTIKNIMNNHTANKYAVQRVVSAALCVLKDKLQNDDEERQEIIELYSTELLACIDELTPY